MQVKESGFTCNGTQEVLAIFLLRITSETYYSPRVNHYQHVEVLFSS